MNSLNTFQNQSQAISRSNAIIYFDLEGNILDANDNFLNLFGYTLNEIKGKHHSILLNDEENESIEYIEFWKHLKKGEFHKGEFIRKAKSGNNICIHGSYNPIYNDNGKLVKVMKIVSDITDLKKAEENLRNSLKETSDYKYALDESAIVAITDQKGTIKYVNDKFCKISKFSREELIGQDHRIVNSGYHSKAFIRDIWTTIAKGELWKGEIKNKAKDGTFYWVNTTIIPFLNEHGKPFQYVTIRFDITDLIQTDKHLRESLKAVSDYKLALDKSAIVAITDQKGIIKHVNDKFCEISKYSNEELIGQDHRIINSGYHSKEFMTDLWTTIANRNLWKGEIKNKAKDGTFYWVDSTIIPFLNDQGKPFQYIAIRFDVTKQKEMQELLEIQAEELKVQQEELQEANSELEAQNQKLQISEEELRVQQEELIQSSQEIQEKSVLLEENFQVLNEKNEELESASDELFHKAEELALSSKYKSEFLANMSHELRTPLNSILLLSKLLADNPEGNLTEEQAKFASVIHDSGNGLLELISEILDLSKIESGKMDFDIENASVTDICKRMTETFSPFSKIKGISFLVKKEKGCPIIIKTDRSRVEQVLKNFLSNSFKFTEKGSIEIIVRLPDERESKKMKIDPANYISFEVKDTGIGIPADKQALVFEAFQQADGSTKRKYGGTGLGLSISREITHLLGGEILLKSQEGEGSSFTLVIPTDSSSYNSNSFSESTSLKVEPTFRKKTESIIPLSTIDKDIVLITPDQILDDRLTIEPNDKVISIIEDDTAFAFALLKFMRERGYKVIVTVNGALALADVVKYKPAGILLDIQLPKKSGWTVMNELKKNSETMHIPVMVMSSSEIKSKDVIGIGGVDFVKKPITKLELDTMLNKLEMIANKSPKTILLVDDNEIHTAAISRFLEDPSKIFISAGTAKEAYDCLNKNIIDCVVLDMGLPDENGYQFLETIKGNKKFEKLPVIIYTGKSLSVQEEKKLKQYASAIIIKTVDSFNRLSKEISLFLHLEDKQEEKILQNDPVNNQILKGKQILVVDDDVRNIFSLTKLLESQEMKVSSASDGIEAMEILNADENIDLVLMDMMMPNKDGYETTSEIRMNAKFKKLPVIAVTAKAMLGDREKCINAGANDYISKPVDGDQLLSLMRIWFNKK